MVRALKHKTIFRTGFEFHLADTLLQKEERTFRHTHDFFEIFLLREGKIWHFMNQERVEITPGVICFINPSDEHSFMKAPEVRSALMTNIAFTPHFYNELVSFLFGEPIAGNIAIPHNPVKIDTQFMQQLKDQTSLLMHRQNEFNAERQTGIIKCLLVNILMQISQSRKSSKPEMPLWLKDTCRQMNEKNNYSLGLNRMISISGKSQEHLTRAMKKYMSLTPTGFINNIRLREAAHLLRSTPQAILDIIYETGFNNISHFNRVFKTRFDTTPRQYRKNNNTIIDPE